MLRLAHRLHRAVTVEAYGPSSWTPSTHPSTRCPGEIRVISGVLQTCGGRSCRHAPEMALRLNSLISKTVDSGTRPAIGSGRRQRGPHRSAAGRERRHPMINILAPASRSSSQWQLRTRGTRRTQHRGDTITWRRRENLARRRLRRVRQNSPRRVRRRSIRPTSDIRLRTELAEGKMAFVGVGGDIEGVVNPTLRVNDGDVVQVSLVNNDGIEHDVVFPEFNAATDRVNRKGASSVTVFRADKSGEYRVLLLAAWAPAGGHGRQDCRRQPAGLRWRRCRHRPASFVTPPISPGPLPAGPPRTLGRRSGGSGARRQARERDDVQLLDVQRQGAGAVSPRARRRHRRAELQEPGGQPHDPLH